MYCPEFMNSFLNGYGINGTSIQIFSFVCSFFFKKIMQNNRLASPVPLKLTLPLENTGSATGNVGQSPSKTI